MGSDLFETGSDSDPWSERDADEFFDSFESNARRMTIGAVLVWVMMLFIQIVVALGFLAALIWIALTLFDSFGVLMLLPLL